MKPSVKSNAIVTYAVVALFVLSLGGLYLLYNSHQKKEQSLNESKLQTEALLSEKLSIEKQIGQLKNDIMTLNGKNSDLDRLLAETSKKIDEKEAAYRTVVNNGNSKAKSLQNQLSQLQKLKGEIIDEKEALAQSLNQLKSENKSLNDQIASLQDKNRKYEEDIALLKSISADNYKVESLKGKKDKLTINSKKARKIVVGFDVPQKLTEDVNFKVTTPQGKVFASNEDKNKTISMKIIENDESLVASLSPMTGNFEISKRIEMTYKPKEKLKPGVYKIHVYNGETYLGSCQLRLK